MSLVTSRVGLRHLCTIERDATRDEEVDVQTDPWGNPVDEDWQPHLEDLPCRAWTNAGREPVDDETTVVLEDRRITVALGTDVTEADRVEWVKDRYGIEIFDGPMNIQTVLRFTDHLELVVERVR
jgi:hypothetical protein